MKRLTKSQAAEKVSLVAKIESAHAALEKAVGIFNAEMEGHFVDVSRALETYNAAIQEADAFTQDVVNEMEEYESERSEQWPDSDAGSAFADWRAEWENELEEAELDEPELLDVPDSASEDLDSRPDEVDSL